MECQINHQKSKALQTQHKDGLHAEHWSLPTKLQLYFFALHSLSTLDHGRR